MKLLPFWLIKLMANLFHGLHLWSLEQPFLSEAERRNRSWTDRNW